jgi:hypothetical protein
MEMDLLGTSLKAGQPLAMALAGVHPRKARKTRTVVDQLLQSMDKKTVGVALLAMSNAAKTATSEIEVVWSGPTPHGALGRTTWAVLDEVVQNAHEYIYAATYSAGHGAPAIKALRGALNRGLAVTCLVDVHNRPEAVAILKSELPGNSLSLMDTAHFFQARISAISQLKNHWRLGSWYRIPLLLISLRDVSKSY